MPSINENFLNTLDDNYLNYSTFVESGTHRGETILNMENLFENLYTIEVVKQKFKNVKNKSKKINFILGKSDEVFKKLLPTIKENTIFFLDAHSSLVGNFSKYGVKDCPLIEEIININNLFKNNKAIIIIDDYRLFEKKTESGDWRYITKEKILEILKPRITKVYHRSSVFDDLDRLIIHIDEISMGTE